MTLAELLNPLSPEARTRRLPVPSYLRELALAAALALAVPAGLALGLQVGLVLSNRLEGVALFGLIGALPGMLVAGYGVLRLHAATIARERDRLGGREPLIYAPFKGPLLVRRSFLPGTARARIVAGLPATLGLLLAVLAVPGGFALPLIWLPGAALIVHLLAVPTLLTPQLSSSASQ